MSTDALLEGSFALAAALGLARLDYAAGIAAADYLQEKGCLATSISLMKESEADDMCP
tara:strand:- start:442 stop:615 length:174 start_codon:yes stop_codon:yes gene_type:complete